MDKCKTCYGYGLWAVGEPNPVTLMDVNVGMPTLRCPGCGKDSNPVKKVTQEDLPEEDFRGGDSTV